MRKCNKCGMLLAGWPLRCYCGSTDLQDKDTGHGGSRPGAGRKTSGEVKRPAGIRITDSTREYLREIGNGSMGAGVEKLVKEHRK